MSSSGGDFRFYNAVVPSLSRTAIGSPIKWDKSLRPEVLNSSTQDGTRYYDSDPASNNDQSSPPSVDCVILCALPEERNMLLNANHVSQNQRIPCFDFVEEFGFSFQTFTLDEFTFAIIALPKVGMVPSACVASRALVALRPRIICMSGICAGRLGKTSLGSIVIATSTYDYTVGKYDSNGTFLPRPHQVTIDNLLSDYLVNSFDENAEWAKVQSEWRAHEPSSASYPDGRIVRGIIGCGNSVIDNITVIESASRIQDELVAIDMESFGVAYAANTSNTPWLIVKSVQDLADGNKQSTEQSYRNFAAFSSGLVLVDCAIGFLKTQAHGL